MDLIPFDRYDALLFDLDGTLANSMDVHNRAWIETLAELGCKVTAEILRGYAGISSFKTVEIFNQSFGWKLDPESVVNEKEQRFLHNIDQVRPIEPVLQVVQRFHGQKGMAIVSGGARENVSKTLSVLELEKFFSVVLSAEDVARGKPHPDPFLRAAGLLGVNPEKCLVFEDGEAGIQGAQSAGMAVVKVDPDFTLQWMTRR